MKTIIAGLALTACLGATAQTVGDKQIMNDAKEAMTLLVEKENALQEFFDTSAGYVIFPNVGEGGFIIGAASGNGVLYENGSAQGMADLKKVDVGFQIGGQAVTEVIFFETQVAVDEFKTGDFEIAGEVAAVAIKEGASEKLNYDDNVLVVAMPKAGLMADVSVGGQKFNYTPMEELEQ